jgi:hypothetical protein
VVQHDFVVVRSLEISPAALVCRIAPKNPSFLLKVNWHFAMFKVRRISLGRLRAAIFDNFALTLISDTKAVR